MFRATVYPHLSSVSVSTLRDSFIFYVLVYMAPTCLSQLRRFRSDCNYQILLSDFSSTYRTDVTSDLEGYMLCSENLRDSTQSFTVNMFLITYFMFFLSFYLPTVVHYTLFLHSSVFLFKSTFFEDL